MPLQLNLGDGHVALVDPEDYEDLADFRWRWRPVRNCKEVQAARYVTVNGKRRLAYLHDEIMQPPEGNVVVFRNRNRLDCRRSNLLVVPKEEAPRYRRKRPQQIRLTGIRYNKREKVWIAEIKHDGVRRHLGKFRSQLEAVLAYDRAQEEYESHLWTGEQTAARFTLGWANPFRPLAADPGDAFSASPSRPCR